MDDKKAKVLEHYQDPSDKELVNYYFEQIEKVSENNIKKETNFLDPHKLQIVENISNIFSGVDTLAYGGFKDCERKKVLLAPSAWNITKEMVGVNILSIDGNFEFEPISHRDVLGAILSLGLKREKIGDIIINNDTINVAVDSQISDYIIQNLNMIKKTTVNIQVVDEQEIDSSEDYVKEIKGTVASLRLDSVASVGFGASRNKMKELIKAQRVKLNWKQALDPKCEINEDDVISLQGKGRIQIASVGKKSRKGRRHILIRRYK
ncbi:RNA-binding protein [Natranaerofaba carboxydovora]|uniref:YlmH family RNA-binding protein n=1 Tax=Natranaerofaba carboxydovora TaxID=2742683 RepID=UPI001F12ED06|nr:YlmH/Sll1252 family protein [Natranaerofaba carboxydovora]UMZ73273.1 S4 domain protein [Natranaerofaba carboxydovora]